jgi:hypothetical protein
MTTKIAFKNIDGTHALRRYVQKGDDGELCPEGVILPGQTVELTVDSADNRRVVLELDADSDIALPVANPQSHAVAARTLRLRTSTHNAKKERWDTVHSEFIPPRGSAQPTLRGPARLEISEMPL